MTNKRIIEDEIDAVRVDFYDKTKNMTSDERIAYIRDQTAPVHSKFAIRTIDLINSRNKRILENL